MHVHTVLRCIFILLILTLARLNCIHRCHYGYNLKGISRIVRVATLLTIFLGRMVWGVCGLWLLTMPHAGLGRVVWGVCGLWLLTMPCVGLGRVEGGVCDLWLLTMPHTGLGRVVWGVCGFCWPCLAWVSAVWKGGRGVCGLWLLTMPRAGLGRVVWDVCVLLTMPRADLGRVVFDVCGLCWPCLMRVSAGWYGGVKGFVCCTVWNVILFWGERATDLHNLCVHVVFHDIVCHWIITAFLYYIRLADEDQYSQIEKKGRDIVLIESYAKHALNLQSVTCESEIQWTERTCSEITSQ